MFYLENSIGICEPYYEKSTEDLDRVEVQAANKMEGGLFYNKIGEKLSLFRKKDNLKVK